MGKKLFHKGRSYLAKGLSSSEQTYLLSALDSDKGIYVTRTDPNRLPNWVHDRLKIIWMSTAKNGKFEKASNPKDLVVKIKKYLSADNSAVMLDRLDYLVNRWTAQEVMDMLYHINDHVVNTQNTLIISINPSILPDDFLIHLEEEFEKMPLPDFKEQIKERPHFMDLLQYLNEKENANSNEISEEFGITRTTARKRLYWLRDNEYIKIMKCGRENRIRLTDKGQQAII